MTPGTASLAELARRVWQLFDGAQRRECMLVLSISIAAACFTVVGVAGVAPFLAVLSDPNVILRNDAIAWLHEALAFQSTDDFLVALGIGFVALVMLADVVNLLAILAIGRFSQRVGARFHVLLFEEYLHRDFRFHARSNSDLLATHVVHDVSRTVSVIQNGLTLFASAASIGLITTAVVVISPVVALGAILALGLSYAAIYATARRRLVRDGATIAQRWGMRSKVIAESFAAIKDIIIFRTQAETAALMARHSEAIAAAQTRAAVIATSPKYVLECVTAAGLVAAALWIYRRAGPGEWLTLFALLGLAAYRLLPPVQQVFSAVARIRSDGAALERIAADFRAARERVPEDLPAAALDAWKGRPHREIRLMGVSYRHSTERAGGVHEVSLQVPAGSLVGLAGPNGSGKTTLANLILGLLVPDAGQVEVDGVLLDDRNRRFWLTTVAHVPQHIVLLDTTVAQNVAFGVPPKDIDIARVEDALRDVRLDAMLDGLGTTIGQNGVQLSGGQRQRLGIARALYRRASLLVLDEATSALDTSTETEVIALLGALRGRCTMVLITHRLSALHACDLVFEMDDGRLIGSRSFAAATRESPSPTQASVASR